MRRSCRECAGEAVYSGELKQPRGLLSFVVHDIARRGTAPTNVRGHLTARGVEFDVRIPFGRRKEPQPRRGRRRATLTAATRGLRDGAA